MIKLLNDKYNLVVNFLYYPFFIIPKVIFKEKIAFDPLLRKGCNYSIVRRCNKDSNTVFNKYGDMLPDALHPSKDVPNMSMNLLGGKFQTKHCKYVQKHSSANLWDGKKVNVFNYMFCISKVNEWTPIYFSLSSLHIGKYKLYIDNAHYETFKKNNYNPQKTTDGCFVELNLEILHAPTMMNYWHVEFIIKNSEGDVVPNSKKGAWYNAMLDSLLINIITTGALQKIDLEQIDLKECVFK